MKPLVSAAVALLLAACSTQLPQPVAGRDDPSDPSAAVPRVRQNSVTAGTADYRPVEPKPWLEQNRAVTSEPAEGMR